MIKLELAVIFCIFLTVGCSSECENILQVFKIDSKKISCDCLTDIKSNTQEYDSFLGDFSVDSEAIIVKDCQKQLINYFNNNSDWKKGKIDPILIDKMSLIHELSEEKEYFFYLKYKFNSGNNVLDYYKISYYNESTGIIKTYIESY
jgi:hypothetical protein